MLEAPSDRGAAPESLQVVDFTMVRAHHPTSGAKG